MRLHDRYQISKDSSQSLNLSIALFILSKLLKFDLLIPIQTHIQVFYFLIRLLQHLMEILPLTMLTLQSNSLL